MSYPLERYIAHIAKLDTKAHRLANTRHRWGTDCPASDTGRHRQAFVGGLHCSCGAPAPAHLLPPSPSSTP